MRTKRIISSVLSLTILVGLVVATIQRQAIYDWYRLRNYTPPSNISQLADATTMTPEAKHLFYINHPAIEDRYEFNQNCPNQGGELTIVLGCYISHAMGIHIYSVNDSKLKGVEQVTAAHEMLHGAYERLSGKDRKRIDGLLQDFYAHGLKDKRILSTIEAYKKTEPNDVVNEMHSIFGTELTKLPAELETYYKRYFENRAKVVAFSEAYQSTFTSRQSQADKLLAQIKKLENQLNGMKNNLMAAEANLSSQYQDLQQMPTETRDQKISYNNQVDAYNVKVNQYKVLIGTYNSMIGQHNLLVNEYKRRRPETSQLLQELNSRSFTIPK